MEDESTHLRRTIERYKRLLKSLNDEHICRELERMIEEAEQRLREIERRRGEYQSGSAAPCRAGEPRHA